MTALDFIDASVHQNQASAPGFPFAPAAAHGFWGGEKFPTGFGITKLLSLDYWTLRQRSSQLFEENLYARGLLRRLVTNEVNIGLLLEAEPNETLIDGLDEEGADQWAEDTENRFEIYAADPRLCDWEGRRTFAESQREARRESLIEGDVLVILRQSQLTGLPQIQLIRGGRVRTPLNRAGDANISHGVELDAKGRQIAYHVKDREGKMSRVPAFGPRSKRRLAWLVYGTDKRMDGVRGTPLLSLILQSMKELDRYRDAEQRAAVVNSIVAMFVSKNSDKPGTMPLSGGATRVTQFQGTGTQGEERQFNITQNWPGMALEELQEGETPHSFDTKRPNVDYAAFEGTILAAIAWANEIPPEILTLHFQNNFSASKAAIQEFKMYLMMFRSIFGPSFCQPVYEDWLLSELNNGNITAAGLQEAMRDPRSYTERGAWLRSSWGGPVKPSIELGKDVKAMVEAIEANLISRDRASKDLFGVRNSRVLKRLRKENAMITELGLEPTVPTEPPTPDSESSESQIEETAARVIELLPPQLGKGA